MLHGVTSVIYPAPRITAASGFTLPKQSHAVYSGFATQMQKPPGNMRSVSTIWSCDSRFSQPKFVTFKTPDTRGFSENFQLKSVFARTWGHAIGKVVGSGGATMARE